MAAPTSVLLMVRELNLGGTERQLAELAKALDRDRLTSGWAASVPADCAAKNCVQPACPSYNSRFLRSPASKVRYVSQPTCANKAYGWSTLSIRRRIFTVFPRRESLPVHATSPAKGLTAG